MRGRGACEEVSLRRSIRASSLRRSRIDDGLYLGDLVCGKPALAGVLFYHPFVRGDIDAINLVIRDITLDPLNSRPHLVEHSAGLLRYGLQLFGREAPRIRDLALDKEPGHTPLLSRTSGNNKLQLQISVVATLVVARDPSERVPLVSAMT